MRNKRLSRTDISTVPLDVAYLAAGRGRTPPVYVAMTRARDELVLTTFGRMRTIGTPDY